MDRTFRCPLPRHQKQPTAIHACHIGSLNASVVHLREVLKPVILANACSVIVAHNHPSNDPSPSSEEIEVTKRLTEAARIIGINYWIMSLSVMSHLYL
ncbi:JAB domain-containing protein [Alteribacillus sp. JSM 102045]|uniref:JAB domain-containing protein n=1 Tax=Alteribacillus sp. JSM 102045 TaxID=1562101 RepID=UPI0035BFA970